MLFHDFIIGVKKQSDFFYQFANIFVLNMRIENCYYLCGFFWCVWQINIFLLESAVKLAGSIKSKTIGLGQLENPGNNFFLNL